MSVRGVVSKNPDADWVRAVEAELDDMRRDLNDALERLRVLNTVQAR